MFGVDENRRDQELQNILDKNSSIMKPLMIRSFTLQELSQQWRISLTQFSLLQTEMG